MYNRVLIITDNSHLAVKFNELLKSGDYNGVQWTFSVSPFSNKSDFEEKLEQQIFQYDLRVQNTINQIISDYDLVFSIHCKQIFPKVLIDSVKCINVHPGYNPINRGWYPQVFAIMNGTSVGATIHEIDEELDHGKIIDRAFVDISMQDTSETLYNKILSKEIELLDSNICKILNGSYVSYNPEEEGKLYLKKDFNSLKKLDLQQQFSGIEFVNLLRAMTHGNYKNLYFIDPTTHKKIFIKIELETED